MDIKQALVQRNRKSVEKTQQFLGIQVTVDADGEEADIILHTSDGHIPLHISFDRIGALLSAISHTDLLMLHRQARRTDKGRAALLDLVRAALRPEKVSVVIDPDNGDRVFIQQFADRSPITTRMAPDALLITLEELAAKARRASH